MRKLSIQNKEGHEKIMIKLNNGGKMIYNENKRKFLETRMM